MRNDFLKWAKILSIGGCLGCLFYTGPTVSVSAKQEKTYIWSEEKARDSEKYYEFLKYSMEKNLNELLDIDNSEEYLSDMSKLYKLSLDKYLVEEVEKIISEYEKEYIYYEMLLLTEDENLAKEYKNETDLYFTFERIGCY